MLQETLGSAVPCRRFLDEIYELDPAPYICLDIDPVHATALLMNLIRKIFV